jgi:PIN domain nuclease of toxin-antitoxin system
MSNWRVQALDITHRHALSASDLPSHDQDPFDRILIAQAMQEAMVLVTANHTFEKYDVRTLWCAT